MDFERKATDTVQRMLTIDSNQEGWKKVKETSDCVVYSKPSDDFPGHNIYRAEGVIPAAAEKVFGFAYPGVEKPRRMEWDKSLTECKVVLKPSPDTDVILTRTAPACMGLVSAREFVDLVKVTYQPDRVFSAAVSIDHPEVEKSSKHIRGFNYPNAMFCFRQPGNPNETRLVQYVQTDLSGILPQSIVESAVPSSMAGMYSQIKAAIAKDNA